MIIWILLGTIDLIYGLVTPLDYISYYPNSMNNLITETDGPCILTSAPINILLTRSQIIQNESYSDLNKITVQGYFKLNTSDFYFKDLNVTQRMLFFIPASSTYKDILLAVSYDQQCRFYFQYGTEDQEMNIITIQPDQCNQGYYFVSVSANYQNMTLAAKILYFYQDNLNLRSVRSKILSATQNFQFTDVYQIFQKLNNINLLLANYYEGSYLKGFCGKFRQVKVFVGQYLFDISENTYFDATQVIQWQGTDVSNATNQLLYFPLSVQGKYILPQLYSSGVGFEFSQASSSRQSGVFFPAISTSQTTPTNQLTVSFWFKMLFINNNLNKYYLLHLAGSNMISIFSIAIQYTFDYLQQIKWRIQLLSESDPLLVSRSLELTQDQGLVPPTYMRITVSLQPLPDTTQYYKVNIFKDDQEITDPELNTLQTRTEKTTYLTDSVTQYIFGNKTLFNGTTSGPTGIQSNYDYLLYDVRIFRGTYIKQNPKERPCALEIGAFNPYCLICNASIPNTEQIDIQFQQLQQCQESRAPPIMNTSGSIGQSIYCPGKTQQIYYSPINNAYKAIRCVPLFTGVWRYQLNTTQALACDSGYLLNNQKCELDVQNSIQMCTNPQTLYCQQQYNSSTNQILELSISCVPGWTIGAFTNLCDKKCFQQSCLKCDSPYECTQCNNQTYLYGGVCLDNCLQTGFVYHDEVSRSCQPLCPYYLYSYETTLDYQGKIYNPVFKCAIQCPLTYQFVKGQKCSDIYCGYGYFSNAGVCQPCCDECQDCFGGSYKECLVCSSGRYLLRTICGLECSPPYNYQNPYNNTCDISCNGLLTVMKKFNPFCVVYPCPSGYIKYQNQCLDYQPQATFIDINPDEIFEYRDCLSMCTSCTDRADNCQSCLDQDYLLNNTCVDQCSLNYFSDDLNRMCVDVCPIQTFIVDIPQIYRGCVLQCPILNKGAITTFQYQNYCLQTCPGGYWQDYIDQACALCDLACTSCAVASYLCQSCADNYYLYDTTCSPMCPQIDVVLFKDSVNHICQTICPSDQFYLNYTISPSCVVKCPQQPQYYTYATQQQCLVYQPAKTYCDQNLICLPCDTTCYVCSGPSSTNCTGCDSLSLLQNNQCVATCSDLNQFSDLVNRKCVDICPEQLWVSGQNCIQSCLGQQYQYSARYCFDTQPLHTYCIGIQCSDCAFQCDACTGPSNQECQQCKSNFYLLRSTCQIFCDLSLYYMDKVNWACVIQCNSSDFTLKDVRQCLSTCNFYTYQSDLQYCYKECPLQTYSVDSQMICLDCHPYCQVCTSNLNTDCQSCLPGYFRINTTCDVSCPNTHPWMDVVNWMCQYRCPIGTYSYRQNFTCMLNCPDGQYTYENQRQCVTQCKANTFIEGMKCYDCDPSCTRCFGIMNNQCTNCTEYYFKEETSCVQSCSSQNPYLLMKNGEYQCFQYCNISTQYVEPYLKRCYETGCPPFYFIYQDNNTKFCYKLCPNGYYGNYDSNSCELCADECLTCYDSSKYDCSKCQKTGDTVNYLYLGYCSDSCPITYWKDTINYICISNCSDEQFYDTLNKACVLQCQKYSYGQLCIDQCPQQTYPNGYICYDCYDACQVCSGPSNNECQQCIQGYYLQNQESCVTVCDTSTPYRDKKTQQCLKECIPPDVTNPENYDCSQYCDTGLVQDGFKCVQQCSDGKFVNPQDICTLCSSKCLTCYGQLDSQCFSCKNGYYLDQTTCTTTCSSSIFFYMDQVNNQCQVQCPTNTFSLMISTTERYCISSCPQLTYLVQCVSQCPKKTYQNNTNCYDCSYGCEICTNEQCFQCIDSYYFYQNTCYEQCPDELYQNEIDLTCALECPINTLQIKQYRLSCIKSCPWDDKFKYYQQDRLCVEQCPPDRQKGHQCVISCATGCKTCNSQDNQQCYTCIEGYFLQGQSCVLVCTNQLQYSDYINNVCQDECPPETTIFDFNNNRSCLLVCPEKYYSYQFVCYEQCPQQTYVYSNQTDVQINQTNVYFCYDCSPECFECYGSRASTCSQCNEGYYLYSNTCSRGCPKNYYQDIQSLECIENCTKLIIQDKMQCVQICPTIPDYYYLYHKQCILQCPEKTYLDFNQCKDCALECSSCFGETRSQCIECIQGFYFYDSFCGDNCPHKLPYRDQIINKCVDTCSNGTYTVPALYLCVSNCPDGYFQYLGDCLQNCPLKYFPKDSGCNQCHYSCLKCTGPLKTHCTQCSDGYFLYQSECNLKCPQTLWRDYRDHQCVLKCPKDLLIVQIPKFCVLNCIVDYPFRYNDQCLLKCSEGRYANKFNFCDQCSFECKSCMGLTSCLSCNPGYFLHGTTCNRTCPSNMFRDISTNQCAVSCPGGMYQDLDTCSFSCSNGQIKDRIMMKCVTSCSKDYYNDGQYCQPCSLECNGCYGPQNTDCIDCNVNFQYHGGKCTGQCPEVGYTQINNQCKTCAFKCYTCEHFQDNCLSCKGDRDPLNFCKCTSGYYDDNQNENCQQCPDKCVECVSSTQCTKCKNNKIGSDCFCLRPPPTEDAEWCVDCNVAYPRVYFTENIDYINVDFGYQINLNVMNPFIPSVENCAQIFSSRTFELFGDNPQCNLDIQSKSNIIIQLGWGSTIQIGDLVKLQQNMVQDNQDPGCLSKIQNFIGTFLLTNNNNFLQPPPVAILDVPSKNSPLCQDIVVSIKSRQSSGGRNFTIIQWKVLSINNTSLDDKITLLQNQINLDLSHSQFKEQLIINPNYLAPSSTYQFEFIYTNFLQTLGSTYFEISVSDYSTPTVKINLNANQKYYSYQNITVPIKISNIQCFSGEINSMVGEAFQAQFILSNYNTQIYEEIVTLPANTENYNFIIPKNTVNSNDVIELSIFLISIINPARKCYDNDSLIISSGELLTYFSTQNRLIGYGSDKFNITIIAQDPSNKTSTFDYIWTCYNLLTLQKCRYQLNNTIFFKNQPTIYIVPDELICNQTYIFYVSVSKQGVLSQIIAITSNRDIDELPFSPDYSEPQTTINPTSQITNIIDTVPDKKNKYYFMLIYDWKVLTAEILLTPTVSFRVWDYQQDYPGSNRVVLYILPNKSSEPFYFYRQPKINFLNVSPQSGVSLLDEFNIVVGLNSTDCTVQFFYYFFEDVLVKDIQSFSFSLGIPLGEENYNNTVKAKLPAGITLVQSIYILVKVTSPEGAISTQYQKITVTPQGRNIKETLQDTNLILYLAQIHISTMELKNQEDYSCYSTCSGYGQCLTIQTMSSCVCQSGRTFSDCSGTTDDIQLKQNFIKQILYSLVNFTNQISQQNYYAQKLIFDISQYAMNNIQMSELVRVLNATELNKYIDTIDIQLQFDLDKMIDFQNQLSNDTKVNFQSTDSYSTDLGQIIEPNEIINHFRIVGGMLAINSNSFGAQNLNQQGLRQLSSINQKIKNCINTLSEIMISIQVPGDAVFSIHNEHLSISTFRGLQKSINKILKQNISLDTFSNISQEVILNSSRTLQIIQKQSILRLNQNIFLDQICIFFTKNTYSYDSNFPYQGQNFPVFKKKQLIKQVYDMKLRPMGRKTNIKLEQPIIFDFKLSNPLPKQLVCIQLDQITNIWNNLFCVTSVFDSLVQCKCSNLDITTIISDIHYKYQTKPLFPNIILPKQILLLYIFIITSLCFLMLLYGIQRDKIEKELFKKGQTYIEEKKQLKTLVNLFENKQKTKDEDDSKETNSLSSNVQLQSKEGSEIQLHSTKQFSELSTPQIERKEEQILLKTFKLPIIHMITSRRESKFILQKEAKKQTKKKGKPFRQFEKKNKFICDNFHVSIVKKKQKVSTQLALNRISFQIQKSKVVQDCVGLCQEYSFTKFSWRTQFVDQKLGISLNTVILIPGNIFLHCLEYYYWQILKELREINLIRKLMKHIRWSFQIVQILGVLAYFIQIYLSITEQNYYSDQIVSFGYAFLVDVTIFEFIRFLYKKYFHGIDARELFKKVQKMKSRKIEELKFLNKEKNRKQAKQLEKIIYKS